VLSATRKCKSRRGSPIKQNWEKQYFCSHVQSNIRRLTGVFKEENIKGHQKTPQRKNEKFEDKHRTEKLCELKSSSCLDFLRY
jgi:hypothetical protein